MTQKIFKPKNTTKGRYANDSGLAAKVAGVTEEFKKAAVDLPNITPGDTLKVHVRIKEGEKERIQVFEGVCIKIKRLKGGRSFTVRKMSSGIGVERVFLEASPKLAKVEVARRGRVRRAKLYYLRELEGRAAKIDRDMRMTKKDVAARKS